MSPGKNDVLIQVSSVSLSLNYIHSLNQGAAAKRTNLIHLS